jgi:hypothetical protein
VSLLNPGAPALNQDDQHKNKEYAGSDTDNSCGVHCDIPLSMFGSHLARMVRNFAGSTGSPITRELLNPAAAALDQEAQNQNEKHTGYHSDDCRAVHCNPPFF